jgi:hypothetical protein
VPSGGSGIRDTAGAGFGHTHFILNDLYLAGNNAVGIRNTNANTNQIGYIDHILEIGTPTGTTGILFTASGGVAKITASEIAADTAYDISGGSLYLSCPKVTGTRTGTPAVEISNALVKTDIVRAATTTLQILGTDGVPGIQIAADGAVKMGAETGDVWIEGLGSDTPGVRSPGLMIGYSDLAALLRFNASGGLAIDVYDDDVLVDAWVEAMVIDKDGTIRMSGNVGIGTIPSYNLHVKAANPLMVVQDTESAAGSAEAYYIAGESDGAGGLQETWTWGYQNRNWILFGSVLASNAITVTIAGNVGINAVPSAKLHVDQASTTAAIPPLILDQADLSEEMIEFVTTVGTGNPIEAVGAKTLTTTHFIRVTIPGVGYRYIPAGTIASIIFLYMCVQTLLSQILLTVV